MWHTYMQVKVMSTVPPLHSKETYTRVAELYKTLARREFRCLLNGMVMPDVDGCANRFYDGGCLHLWDGGGRHGVSEVKLLGCVWVSGCV